MNKYQEALDFIIGKDDTLLTKLLTLRELALKKAVSIDLLQVLVDKETPKKPVSERYLFECPVCGHHLIGEQRRCDNCGQKIDWEEEE